MKENTMTVTKRLFMGFALLAGFVLFSLLNGCTFDAEHNRAHWASFEQDVQESHKFVDRTFFNYDWDDPDNWYIEEGP